MYRHALIILFLMAVAFDPAPGADPPTSRPDLDGRITAYIEHLGSANKHESRAAIDALVRIGKPAAPALVKSLTDVRSDLRANAANVLRQVLATDPSTAPNKHDKVYWQQQLAQVKIGMLLKDALAILLPTSSHTERAKAVGVIVWNGSWGIAECRLDDYWIMKVTMTDVEMRIALPPDLIGEARQMLVDPAPDFTGTWVNWFVNGQKSTEIQYRHGRRDGTYIGYYDDGGKCVEQHYVAGVINGSDISWFKSGKKSDERQYDGGKQIGTWRHWTDDESFQPQN